MPHRFDPANMARLDDPERKKNLPPGDILLAMGLRRGDTFLDIGAGTGYFSFPAAEMVGEEGRVIATDLSDRMAGELSRRVAASGKKNIRVMLTGGDGPDLPEDSVDFAFLCNVMHEVENKKKLLLSIRKTLKKKGKIGIVEWRKEPTPNGPPVTDRLDAEELSALLTDSGFVPADQRITGNAHYFLTAVKP